MKYLIDCMEVLESAEAAAEYIIENMSADYYEDMLRECYGNANGDIEICGLSYDVAAAFDKLDPIAFNCGMTDYYDSLRDDIVWEIERLDIGEKADIYGFEVYGESDYEQLAHKMVMDSDGFMTDYTLYSAENENGGAFYVCIFGDNEMYTPDEDEPDFITEDRREAFEWFDSYNGFDDDGEEDNGGFWDK